jgi:hypothetical protein
MRQAIRNLASAVFFLGIASAQTASQSITLPPDALIDKVIEDTGIKAQAMLALDSGYGVGLESWDGRQSDIRKTLLGRQLDLNGDGQREWLVIIASHVTCNETQLDCRLMVYSGQKDGYRRLWTHFQLGTGPTIGAHQLGEVKAGPGQSNKWMDLSWVSAKPTTKGKPVGLKFDGQAYR